MLFNTIFHGLIATAAAAPQLLPRAGNEGEAIVHAARGINYSPRAIVPRNNQNGNSNNNFNGQYNAAAQIAGEQMTILQNAGCAALEKAALEEEVALTQAIQLQMQAEQELKFAIDNIRINTFKNLNAKVNVILVVVTKVVDNRNNGKNAVNGNKNRYLVRQVQSNPAGTEQAFVQINEQETMTINNNVATSAFAAAQASGTGFAAPNQGIYTPGANISQHASGINMLPPGAAAPQFGNAKAFDDPAQIILPNVDAFVQLGATNVFVVEVEKKDNNNNGKQQAGKQQAGKQQAGNQQAGKQQAGKQQAGKQQATKQQAAKQQADKQH